MQAFFFFLFQEPRVEEYLCIPLHVPSKVPGGPCGCEGVLEIFINPDNQEPMIVAKVISAAGELLPQAGLCLQTAKERAQHMAAGAASPPMRALLQNPDYYQQRPVALSSPAIHLNQPSLLLAAAEQQQQRWWSEGPRMVVPPAAPRAQHDGATAQHAAFVRTAGFCVAVGLGGDRDTYISCTPPERRLPQQQAPPVGGTVPCYDSPRSVLDLYQTSGPGTTAAGFKQLQHAAEQGQAPSSSAAAAAAAGGPRRSLGASR